MIKGTLGNELEVEDGYRAARACAIGLISTIKGSYGSGLMFFFFSASEAVDFRDATPNKMHYLSVQHIIYGALYPEPRAPEVTPALFNCH